MQPEMPYLAAGGIALAGGVIRDKSFPANGVKSVMGTIVLVVVASATANSPLAPLVHAIGMLLVLGALIAATNGYLKSKNATATTALAAAHGRI